MISTAAGIHQEGDDRTHLAKTIHAGESLYSLFKYHPADFKKRFIRVPWPCKQHKSQPTQLITTGSTRL